MNRIDISDVKLSVIVTVFSETFSQIETIRRILDKNRNYILEIILVVSPRSSEECIRIAYDLEKKHDLVKVHIQKNNPGVGWAIREGMELAKGNYIALLSADLETEPEAVDRMVARIEETGCGLVVGNRWLKGGGFQNYDRTKLVLNWMFQKIFKILFLTRIGDLTYGFKILKKEIADKINWEGTLHEIYIETTIKPLKIGCVAEQLPTIWIGRKEGESQNTFLKNFRYVRMAFDVLFKRKQLTKNH